MASAEDVYVVPASLLDHCTKMGQEHDPNNFAMSLPGGIWTTPQKMPEQSRNASMDVKGECPEDDCGVPIFRVDHKMNGDGFIFTPSQNLYMQGAAPAYHIPGQGTAEHREASSSLIDFCQNMGQEHDPTQFGTSVPGGCWGGASMDKPPLSDKEKECGVPITRVDHKMNGDGFIFTPRTKSMMRAAMVVGSLESDSDMSWRGASPGYPGFDGRSPGQASLNLFDNTRPMGIGASHVARGPPPEQHRSIADVLEPLPPVEESPQHSPNHSPGHEAPTASQTPPENEGETSDGEEQVIVQQQELQQEQEQEASPPQITPVMGKQLTPNGVVRTRKPVEGNSESCKVTGCSLM